MTTLIISWTCHTNAVYLCVFCRLRTTDFRRLPTENLSKAAFQLEGTTSLMTLPIHTRNDLFSAHIYLHRCNNESVHNTLAYNLVISNQFTILFSQFNIEFEQAILFLLNIKNKPYMLLCIYDVRIHLLRINLRVMIQKNTQRQAEMFQWMFNIDDFAIAKIVCILFKRLFLFSSFLFVAVLFSLLYLPFFLRSFQ